MDANAIGGGGLAIEARGLVQAYGDVVAVDGLDLSVARGTCLGLLGPNGAGKTTTIEILEGLKSPDAGEVRILGQDWCKNGAAIRAVIGVQLQETQLTDKMTVLELVRLFRSFYPDGRTTEEVLELVGLTEKRDARHEHLSGGQRQRLALGCALVNWPFILFLDEPTTGLDPQARRRVWEIVEDFKANGGTVLLTTHYMDEAERLADQLVIIDHGKIIAEGTPRALVASLGAVGVVEFTLADIEVSIDTDRLETLPGVQSLRRSADRYSLGVGAVHSALPAVLAFLEDENAVLSDLTTHRANLEDVFVNLTGRHLRDE